TDPLGLDEVGENSQQGGDDPFDIENRLGTAGIWPAFFFSGRGLLESLLDSLALLQPGDGGRLFSRRLLPRILLLRFVAPFALRLLGPLGLLRLGHRYVVSVISVRALARLGPLC